MANETSQYPSYSDAFMAGWEFSNWRVVPCPDSKDIYLSYFHRAKIGVIGLNGSGKSSLLRILAGVDKEINARPLSLQAFLRLLNKRGRGL